jgi:hypothetical protein
MDQQPTTLAPQNYYTTRSSVIEPPRTRVNDELAAGKGRGTHSSAPSIPRHMPVLAAVFEPVGNDSLKIIDEEVGKSKTMVSRRQDSPERPRHFAIRGRDGPVNYGTHYRSDVNWFSSVS